MIRKALALSLTLVMLLVTTACTSSQFHEVLSMAQTGADYIVIVIGHPEAEPAVNAAFNLASAEYDAFVKGTSTAQKVQDALNVLSTGLAQTFADFHIADPKILGLVQLTVNEILSLTKLIPLAYPAQLHHTMKLPSASQAKVIAPLFKTPAEFRQAFNLVAGANVIK